MKKIYLLFTLLKSVTLFSMTLDISILNHNLNGTLYTTLYKGPKNFLNTSKAYKTIVTQLNNENRKVIIKNIPNGEYAFSMYLDKNNNGKLDTGLFKIPKEPAIFSNNYKPKFKPSYNSAKFTIKNKVTLQKITLK